MTIAGKEKRVSKICSLSMFFNRDLEYWRAIASGLHFLGLSLRKCLFAMHKDIVTVWNIPNMDEVHRAYLEHIFGFIAS